ncbi:hypothetical protein CLV89_1287 [Tritonibacter scottomollicae]|uniref:Uncharacterized protein n=1 Tax=Tritonibacter scottomollicae TaxID=483013 RepID=A0A2T1A3W6_TRISK|nr:hypothetical protein CLV89_1287 [Tritonibacter scottomollicae]
MQRCKPSAAISMAGFRSCRQMNPSACRNVRRLGEHVAMQAAELAFMSTRGAGPLTAAGGTLGCVSRSSVKAPPGPLEPRGLSWGLVCQMPSKTDFCVTSLTQSAALAGAKRSFVEIAANGGNEPIVQNAARRVNVGFRCMLASSTLLNVTSHLVGEKIDEHSDLAREVSSSWIDSADRSCGWFQRITRQYWNESARV